MSFSQKYCKNTNPDQVRAYVSPGGYCNGCGKRCGLGYRYVVSVGHYIYPAINNEIVSYYIDENHRIQYTSVYVKEPRSRSQAFQQEISAKSLAGKIARLCDRYKIR